MNKQDIAKEIEATENKLKELREKLSEPEKALRLEVDACDYLRISYGDENIGYINNGGDCVILSVNEYIENHNQWRKDDMPIDSTPVKWRGGRYMINSDGVLSRIDVGSCNIYDFGSCCAFTGCRDENIKRFEHNNRPIIF